MNFKVLEKSGSAHYTIQRLVVAFLDGNKTSQQIFVVSVNRIGSKSSLDIITDGSFFPCKTTSFKEAEK